MALTQTVAPVASPVTLDELKAHARIDENDQDTYLEVLIEAATEYIEGYLNKALMTQTWVLTTDMWPARHRIFLPKAPLQSVSTVKYLDSAGVQQTVDSAEWRVSGTNPGILEPEDGYSWPGHQYVTGSIEITFVCGYASADVIPSVVKYGVMKAATDMFESPQDMLFNTRYVDTNHLARVLASQRNYGTPGYGYTDGSYRVT